MARLNKLLTGHQITDEVINRTSSASLPLGHDTILQTGVVVRTAAGGGGTLLTLTTDYTLGSADSRLTTEAGQNVYTKLAIVNGAYQSTNLYVTYKSVGDYGSAETIYKASVDIIYPVGSFYTQYPDADSNDDATEFPVAYRPATLFGGTWAEQWPTESIYFRTRGTLADYGRTSGKQEDQMQRITGAVNATKMGEFNVRTFASHSGAFVDGTTTSTVKFDTVSATSGTGVQLQFDSGSSPNARVSSTTAGETRTVNRRIKVWKRTA